MPKPGSRAVATGGWRCPCRRCGLSTVEADNFASHRDKISKSFKCARCQGLNSHWLKLLRWPDDTPENYGKPEDWGISWFELTISFIISSQLYFPIRVQGLGSASVYADYHSPECLIQHPKKRAAYVQTFCLHKLVSALQTASGVQLFPKFNKSKCRSLQRLGFSEKHTGIPCRPIFPHQEATMRYVWQYLQTIGHGGYLNKPLDVPKIDPILPVCPFSEIPPDQRYKNYLKMTKRLRRKQHDDS